jgi:hypothetical protein
MKTKLCFYLAYLLLVGLNATAIEPEPNWSKRIAELQQEELAKYVPPKVGDEVTFARTVGGKITGRISSITSDSITISGKKYTSSQVIAEDAVKIFASVHSLNEATKRAKAERDNYWARKSDEEKAAQEKQQQELLAAQARAAELKAEQAEAAKVQALQDAQARWDAEQAKESEKAKQAETAQKVASGLATGIIVLIVLGCLSYFLPAFIAFARGHHNKGAIFLLNLLLGWTFIGWVVCLVWSFTNSAPNNITVNVTQPAAGTAPNKGKKFVFKK